MKTFALILCGVIGYATAALDRQRSGEVDAPTPGGRWIVRLTTSGGIGGSYIDLTIGANGELVARASAANVRCTAHVSDAVVQRLDAALTKSHPERWAAAYVQPSNPNGCCDQFRDFVHVEWSDAQGRRMTRETYWFSDSATLVPPEVTALSNEIYQTRTVCAISD